MGSPFGPLFANFFLDYLDQKYFPECYNVKPTFYLLCLLWIIQADTSKRSTDLLFHIDSICSNWSIINNEFIKLCKMFITIVILHTYLINVIISF